MDNIKQLAAGIIWQAAKDYFCTDVRSVRDTIIADLNSDWMVSLSDGASKVVAEQILAHPRDIRRRLFNQREDQNEYSL